MTEIMGTWGKDLILPVFTVMFTIVYISLFYYALTIVRRRKNGRDAQLKNAISTGLVNGQINGVDDLVNVYRGITNSGDDDVSYKAGVSRVLRRLLVSLATDGERNRGKDSLRVIIKELLKQIETETPFADVPTAERNLIIDARKFINSNEPNAALQKVEDLASLIEVRQEAYEKLQVANKWSVPLAIIGLVLTIVFGVMSLRP